MEYFTFLCVEYNDGTASKKSIYTEETSDKAVAYAHAQMGAYVTQSNVHSVCAMAINSIGGVYCNYHWVEATE